jgi:hypothetical protein
MAKYKILIGDKFGTWEVLDQGEPKLSKNGIGRPKSNKITWKCKCICGYCKETTRDVLERNLLSGKSKGCGTKSRILNGKNNKKHNKYNLEAYDYGICYTDDGVEFIFDKEDYDKIKYTYWTEHRDSVNGYARGYLFTDENNIKKFIFMHNSVMNNENKEYIVDHISGDCYDNRKTNLRLVSKVENSVNQRIKSNNKSGVVGVYYSEKENKWKSYITYNKIRHNLGTYIHKEDAIKIRLKAEEKYFKEYTRADRYGDDILQLSQ